MKKILIPRSDHEVYFILAPEDQKTKITHQFIADQLEKLHPNFTTLSVFDWEQHIFNNTRWIMATVMNGETLAEYKILHKGCKLFTNTSIAVHKKNFVSCGVNTIGDELIGFDTEKNMPISIPLDSNSNELPFASQSNLKGIPARHGVFSKKISLWQYVALIIGIAVILLLPAILIFFPRNITEQLPIIKDEVSQDFEHNFFPEAIEILARFSYDIVNAGGQITRWQYNEDATPFLTVQMQGVDILTLHKIFNQHGFAYLIDIQNVTHIDGEPHTTINLNAMRTDYIIIPSIAFPVQNYFLTQFLNLTNELRKYNITIVSEILPTNNSFYYTITYTAQDWNLVRSMEIISEFSRQNFFRVKRIDIAISSSMNSFTVVCVLAQVNEPEKYFSSLGGRKNMIPIAFGYRRSPPPRPVIAAIPEPEAPPPTFGSIRHGSRQIFFYRDANDGRIRIRGHQ